ncbi:ABC transporter permease [uncultured Paludibaculum sp.]|uniref:ABC transporter permease n=1 Tax=uncultured Paludibaculum sp. TaxID=1765020 RepID=UPI002AAB032A|nr:ABC transporter permease [uncultured Paludibaculum sp.]
MSLWGLFQRKRQESELDEEIRAHFAMAVRDRIERGEDPREAELAVRREFGNEALVREVTRDMWGWRRLEEISQDVRYALRGMRRSPGIAAVVVASLALGVGANTAIFGLVYSILLRSLPVQNPEELVELLQKYPGEPRSNGYWSSRSYEYYRDNSHVFSALTGLGIDNRARLNTGSTEDATCVAEFVVGNYFQTLGVRPALGRFITAGDEVQKEDGAVAVVSWDLWTTRFQRDPAVLGKRISINAKPAIVIGVAPPQFSGLRVDAQTSVWLPSNPGGSLALIGRLKPGVTLEQARAEMTLLYRFTLEERVAAESTRSSPDPQVRQLRVEVEPARAGLSGVRDKVGKQLTVLMAIVGVLLLLACVNVGGLLLARGAGRAREMALRLGLGASSGRLMRQVLTESLVLSFFGTIAGVAVAYLGTQVLVRIMDSGRPHERIHLLVHTDASLLLFCASVAVCCGLLFGLAPALSAIRNAPADALRQSGRASGGRFYRVFGRGLVSAQVALSMFLLSAGGLFVAHLANLKSADLGFRRDHILLVSLDPSRSGYRPDRLSVVYRELLERMSAIPGVRSASLIGPSPLQGAGASGFGTFEGFEERQEDKRWISIAWAGPRCFETLGIQLLAGREFSFRDQTQPRVAIINQTLARRYFGGRNPIGKHVTLDHVTLTRDPATYEIIGVVSDANYMEIREERRRTVYLPAFRDGRVTPVGTFVLRTGVAPRSIAEDARRVVRGTAASLPVANITTLSDQIDSSIVPERMMAALSGFFAVLAALLAGIGLWGLLAYTVTRRTNEIGIRITLGATPGSVSRTILRESLTIVAVGVAAGVPAVLWGKALAARLLQDVAASTTVTLGLGLIAVAGVALLASYGPARRAARLDPMEALRQE